jgi:hypothetical protein
MEQCRCAFARDRASSRYSRSSSINLGLDSINLGCAWTSMTDCSRCNKRNNSDNQSL